MVSNDTKTPTIRLLAENNNFGLNKEQLFIVEQGAGVPALSDNNAKFALDSFDPYTLSTKPHGHGDIHSLLYKEGVISKWNEDFDLDYMVLFQVRTVPICMLAYEIYFQSYSLLPIRSLPIHSGHKWTGIPHSSIDARCFREEWIHYELSCCPKKGQASSWGYRKAKAQLVWC